MTRRLTLAMVLLLPAPAAAEWQVKPFVGITFGGSTSFVDLEKAAGRAHFVIGVTGQVVGEIFGLEADLARAPGFFQAGSQQLVLTSSATTLTGNVVVAMPKRVFQYTLRPYVLAGAGIMRAQIEGRFGTLHVASTLPAMDFGGGATGFLTDRAGLSWELRRFQSFRGGGQPSGVSFGKEQLAFWRVSMAVAWRY